MLICEDIDEDFVKIIRFRICCCFVRFMNILDVFYFVLFRRVISI